ncbi:MAG TPA: DUF1800 domain-containing protein [Vicinamibacteria bacterium]
MKGSWRAAVGGSLLLALAGSPDVLAARRPSGDEDAAIVHALNRLGYGPGPDEVERVRGIGLDRWIDQQLHPEKIDDRLVEQKLQRFETLRLSPAELMRGYEVPREAKKEIQRRRAELGENASEQEMRQLRRELMEKYGAGMKGSPKQVLEELQAAKVLRAAYSERQLDEVLVDFWMNHFNVYAAKGPERFLLAQYERDVVRPHAWGRFEDLLKATAESPAMLFYLDNWLSADPQGSPMARPRQGFFGRRRMAGRDPQMRRPGQQGQAGQGRKRGLNENYAREIMELHTLGVDGGYTQKDVTEVARCFTGWTLHGVQQDQPGFVFEPRIHDPRDKVVLGHKIKAGGKDEGDKVIHLLATHPSTAHFISYKLARHFVADEPPKTLVDRAAETFRRTDGDIRAVVRTIVTSPEFDAQANRAVKVKTPLEFAVSAVRAAGAEVDDPRALLQRVADMGMPLYLQQPPTGYKDTAEAWVSTSGLLARLNLALDLAAGRLAGVRVDLARLAPAGQPLAESLGARLVPSGLTDSTRRTLQSESAADPARVAGLILGSPEFQRR